MATKNEITVDDLLNNFETGAVTKKSNKDNKKAKKGNDWGDDEEDNYTLGFGKDTSATTTKKTTTKKKTQDKGWGELAQEKKEKEEKEKEEAQPVVAEEPKPEEKKKGIMNLKKFAGGENKPVAASVNVEEEYFPTLGEEVKPQPKKKTEPAPTSSPGVNNTAAQTGAGPRKFMNANKTTSGLNFAPLNPDLVEKPVPVQAEKPAPTTSHEVPSKGFIRRSEPTNKDVAPVPTGNNTTTQPSQPADDAKIKFGGEGPKKFVGGNKISFKREEEKSEADVLREAREREIEEKLAKEREEQEKLRLEREARRAAKEAGHKVEEGEHKTEKTEATPTNQEASTEEKKVPRFMNAKKDPSKPNPLQAPAEEKTAPKEHKEHKEHKDHKDKASKAKVEEKPVVEEVHETAHAKEVVEMTGTLSQKSWGEGPIKKTGAKK